MEYVSSGIIGALMCTESPYSNFLKNTIEGDVGDGRFGALVRLIFVSILLFHTPYIFNSVKDSALVIYDEYHGTISNQLEAKLVRLNKKNESKMPQDQPVGDDSTARTGQILQPRNNNQAILSSRIE